MLRHVDLIRTFARPTANADEDDESPDWTTYLDSKPGALTWNHLHAEPVSVVVGEAGIGKTTEFKDETARLISDGQAAFFVELSQLTDGDHWAISLGEQFPAFEAWQEASEKGCFLLDAVDEARLSSHAALKRALRLVHSKLQAHLSRVHVVISSRWTDWSVDDVRASVRESLIDPIDRARRKAEANLSSPTSDTPPPPVDPSPPALAEPYVVSLSPLSIPEARKLARAWNVPEEERFWAAIIEGSYEHMATRPLDLDWMVRLWTDKRILGTYRDLIEGSVRIRLRETNPSYASSPTALSPLRLRRGAEQLAAAAELSGIGYILCGTPVHSGGAVVAPNDVLDEWSDVETSRLLASALFDEATFTRVKFHHRMTRAYLAACWLDAELRSGVAFHRVMSLFVAEPFEAPVLIPARRWALAWLATINAKTREWTVQNFPEMFLFDGDPESWDELSADAAFVSYVRRRAEGFQPDWYNSAAELMRVGKRLSSGLIARTLADHALPTSVKVMMLPFVVHAKLTDCASSVFELFVDPKSSPREQLLALHTLETVATPEQRADIKDRLLSGAFSNNDIIASALTIVGVESLSATELPSVLAMAGPEDEYGNGPMASAIERSILPTTTARSATAFLEAVVAGLPVRTDTESFNKFHGPKPQRAWLLDVLPACLTRLLGILDASLETYPIVCIDAAIRIEGWRNAWYSDHDLKDLQEQIADKPRFRWQLAKAFVQSPVMSDHITRMVWSRCLVNVNDKDLKPLIAQANDEQSSDVMRDRWFQLAKAVALGYLRSRARKEAFATLSIGPDQEARMSQIGADIKGRADSLRHTHHWKLERSKREREALVQRAEQRRNFEASIEQIRNASHLGTLCWLVQYSDSQSGRKNMFHVDYDVIAHDFGVDISEALREGLKTVWRTRQPVDPAGYRNGTVPWEVILALAGFYSLISEGLETTTLNDGDAARAAQFAVWELKRPPAWFPSLMINAAAAVAEAVSPWLVSESQQENPSGSSRRTLDLALGCSGTNRTRLLAPLVSDVLNLRIPSSELFKELFDALREDGAISSSQAEALCKTLLKQSDDDTSLLTDAKWLRVWFGLSPSNAWSWFNENLAADEAVAKGQVRQFVEAISDFKWVRQSEADSAVSVLMQVHAVVSKYRTAEQLAADKTNADMFAPSMTRLLETIPSVLAGIPGRASHEALLVLSGREAELGMKTWLISRLHAHAALAAANSSVFQTSDLRSLGTAIDHEPRSERELFEQALSRLEDLRTWIEEGPFSDRRLFSPGMPEKLLQLWLAARFHDTPFRRFTVHREEEVDDDNKTDIQLGAGGWKVCIEIKPVDRSRYSAVSLTGTLRDQLVGHYLKGENSDHGILLLLRLDDKKWDVPGIGKGQSFESLIAYLQTQAALIKAEQAHVQELLVFGIDCLPPGSSDAVSPDRKAKRRKRSLTESTATTMVATDAHSEGLAE